MNKRLSDVLGNNWMGSIVRVKQSNMEFLARVIGSPMPSSVKPGRTQRALVVPVERPDVKPKWVDPELVTVVELGGVNL